MVFLIAHKEYILHIYLSRNIGETTAGGELAGTYARQILNRLLIDLSWNSSRLEGNTYSLLDTELLIMDAEQAEGKDLRETQMILNHKEAIEFLVGAPQEIGFDRRTIRTLHALLGVYELNRIELLREVFIWAYGRSAARYAAVRQSLGEPDPFRLKRRTELRIIVASVVSGRMGKKQATAHIRAWARQHIDEPERARFRRIAERELTSLHEGNFARFRISPPEFAAWQTFWHSAADRSSRPS